MRTKDKPTIARPTGILWALAIACGLNVSSGEVSAGAIRRHHVHAAAVYHTEASLGPAWQRFLSGGPSLWALARPPRFPSHLVLATRNGTLVSTPFVAYLEWRRGLAPARFDYFHPRIASALAQFLTTPGAVSPTTITTGPGTTTPTVQPQNTVPEPGTFAATLTLFGLGLCWRRRLQNQPPPVLSRDSREAEELSRPLHKAG